MTAKQSLFFRILLFLFGAGIVVSAFFLWTREKELTESIAFIWVSIAVMYLVFFTPFFFSMVRVGNFSLKIPPLAFVWTGIIVYIILSVVNIVLLSNGMSFTKAFVAQCILLFLFFIDVYFAYFASGHVSGVAMEEKQKQQYTNELKAKAQTLLLRVRALPAEYEPAQKEICTAIEECKYIYPVDNGAGDALELKIIAALQSIEEICGLIAAGGRSTDLEQTARNLRLFVKERKLLRN
ncbi:MAG: hypothetical protein LBC77_01460 [Spirochaetaceae bacterium]|jgi:hypothetical protein|nr:hypothetical protein [Spirochaetaceae bacterium]